MTIREYSHEEMVEMERRAAAEYTPAYRLRRARQVIGWSVASAAQRTACSARLWARFEANEPGYPVPDDVLEWIEGLAQHLRANPTPHAVKRTFRSKVPLPGV